MPFDDLRSLLTTLDKQGQLLHVTDEVSAEPDMAAAAKAVSRMGDAAPALYFDNVTGFTSARIAMNVHGSWANHALALGLPKETGTEEQIREFIQRWEHFPVAPEWRENPPWAENTRAQTSTSSRCCRWSGSTKVMEASTSTRLRSCPGIPTTRTKGASRTSASTGSR
jgi:UbiD family decarboxylase